MRAWLIVCAALALAPCRATAAHAPHPARLERIKSHILAKLGLTSRPMPLGAPPRDVVQEILHRAQDNQPPVAPAHDERAMREIIAIAQTGFIAKVACLVAGLGGTAAQRAACRIIDHNLLTTGNRDISMCM